VKKIYIINMIKYGIKLWTINKTWFKEAVNLFQKKQVDFIELYVVPNYCQKDDLKIFQKAEISIHAPHFTHSFDIFQLDAEKEALFKSQIIKIADFLNSKYIILHAGTGSNPNIFRKNFKKIYDKRILIENLPKVGLDDRICFGYSLEQLNFIKSQCKADICLDISHAIKSAISQKINYKNFLKSLILKLKPNYFHLCDGKLNNEKDKHFNLGEGDFDLKWIKEILINLSLKKDIFLVFETPKCNNNLKNDIKNINYFKNL